jgi:hypothetical protein
MKATSGTHVITVVRIVDWVAHGKQRRDAWEIWGPVDVDKCTPGSPAVAWTYWTEDPTVVDTCELARLQGVPVTIDWVHAGRGMTVTGCELWQQP